MVAFIRSNKFSSLSTVLVTSALSAIYTVWLVSVYIAIGSISGPLNFPVDTNSRISCAETLVCVQAAPSVGSISGVPYGGPIG